jgi:hypothetical protein
VIFLFALLQQRLEVQPVVLFFDCRVVHVGRLDDKLLLRSSILVPSPELFGFDLHVVADRQIVFGGKLRLALLPNN